MKIHDIGGHGGPRRPDDPGSVDKRENAVQRKTVDRDRVDLSEAARSRLDLLKAAESLPEIREERISRLRSELESDAYRVDARKLAEAILEFEDGLRD